jgi:phage terminase large subunit-like protein
VGLHGSERQHGNLYPTKARPEQKIDAAVAMMAVGRAMAEVDGQGDIMEFLRNPIFG